jgi:hypothetical protein
MQSRRFTRLGILNKMMTFKIRYHCDYFSIRLRFELIEGGRRLGFAPLSPVSVRAGESLRWPVLFSGPREALLAGAF